MKSGDLTGLGLPIRAYRSEGFLGSMERRHEPKADVRIARPSRRETTGPLVQDEEKRALFDAVFMPHLGHAYRLARWLTGNGADAEDVVQEASLRAFRGIGGFGGIHARAWVLTVVRNTAYSWLLKNRPAAVVFAEDLDPEQREDLERPDDGAVETPESQLLDKADAETIRNAVAALPPPFRDAIVLREMHELNYREIAEITGVPIGTVMSRLARARRLLTTALKERAS